MTGKWDSYAKPKFDQDHVGELVDCMEVLEQVQNGDHVSLKLHCVQCDRKFWADLKEGGKNTVVRQNAETGEKEIHVKCPQSGCEWDGQFRHFYAIQRPVDAHPSQSLLGDFNIDMAIIETVEADDPITALTMYAETLDTETRNKYKGLGLSVLSIPGSLHRDFQKKKAIIDKLKSGDASGMSDLLSAMFSTTQEQGGASNGQKGRPKTNDEPRLAPWEMRGGQGVGKQVQDPAMAAD